MTSNTQYTKFTSGIRRRAASAALTLAVVLGLVAVSTHSAQAQTYQTQTWSESVLFSFNDTDGLYPQGLALGSSGTLYGTTSEGGAYEAGVVFRLTNKGSKSKETVLYTFTGGADGADPHSGLTWDAKRENLYGTTSSGGLYSNGTVFKVNPKSKKETVIYSFNGIDGTQPEAQLIRDGKGNLYGTNLTGGDIQGSCYSDSGCGTVFKVNPKTKTETVLYTFTGGTDGQNPYGGLIWDAKGNLYGTTLYGGAYGHGTVFEVDPKAKTEKVLYSFSGPDGWGPYAGLTFDKEGTLYGTTWSGGAYGYGVVFELNPETKTETVLYSFTGQTDGAYPSYSLILDAKGNLYSTAGGGDTNGDGVVFEVNPKTKTETVLYSFTGGTDASGPGPLIWGAKRGNLYGTAGGGTYGDGAVFKLSK